MTQIEEIKEGIILFVTTLSSYIFLFLLLDNYILYCDKNCVIKNCKIDNDTYGNIICQEIIVNDLEIREGYVCKYKEQEFNHIIKALSFIIIPLLIMFLSVIIIDLYKYINVQKEDKEEETKLSSFI